MPPKEQMRKRSTEKRRDRWRIEVEGELMGMRDFVRRTQTFKLSPALFSLL